MNISAVYGVTEATFTASQTVVAICIFDIVAIVVVIVFVVCVHMRMACVCYAMELSSLLFMFWGFNHPEKCLVCSTMRICTESCVLNGVTFDKGVKISIPVRTLHYDPSLWDEPTSFNPNR